MKKTIKLLSLIIAAAILSNIPASSISLADLKKTVNIPNSKSPILNIGDFISKKITFKNITYKYSVYLPNNYSKNKKWPAILFIHGSGEMGTDGKKQTKIVKQFLSKNSSLFPAVIVMPQYNDKSLSMVPMIIGTLDKTEQQYSIDKNREYITGLSAGGYFTWEITSLYPNRFAAAMPISGGFFPSTGYEPMEVKASRLVNIPIWAFHGDSDDIVPVSESIKAVTAVKNAGGKPKLTIYKGVKHNAWDYAYYDKKVIEWLFAQKKK
jgi:predicted peptidase